MASAQENAEMVLNHLGCVVRYHDIAKGLPTPEDLAGIRGLITWFTDEQLPGAEAYCRWLLAQLQAGTRLVMLGRKCATRHRRAWAYSIKVARNSLSEIRSVMLSPLPVR